MLFFVLALRLWLFYLLFWSPQAIPKIIPLASRISLYLWLDHDPFWLILFFYVWTLVCLNFSLFHHIFGIFKYNLLSNIPTIRIAISTVLSLCHNLHLVYSLTCPFLRFVGVLLFLYLLYIFRHFLLEGLCLQPFQFFCTCIPPFLQHFPLGWAYPYFSNFHATIFAFDH